MAAAANGNGFTRTVRARILHPLLSVAELTGSSLLACASTDARMRLNDLLNAIPVLKLNIANSAAQHAAIVAAILAGDTERARVSVAEHLEGTGALLRFFLGELTPQPEWLRDHLTRFSWL